MPFVSRDQRIELAVGGTYSPVAVVFTWFVPLEVEGTLDPKPSPVDLCRGLRIAAEATASAPTEDLARRSWPWHVLTVGAGALYTALVGCTTHPLATRHVDRRSPHA